MYGSDEKQEVIFSRIAVAEATSAA